MKFAELKPQWLTKDGSNVGIIFQCPHCRTTRMTVMFVPMQVKDQWKLWPGTDTDLHDVVSCRPDFAWSMYQNSTFENMTITPSLDASRSGHWHGHITNGEMIP